ncbi:MAG: MBL fold metallo-hydrolase [Rhodothermales bacterium]|nr:MBL fold metallo-hydrolase [Rhodothermales bacterium]
MVTGTLLGTGTSTGVPVIGCSCRTCTSDDPRDRRLRCSCLVEADGVRILIDAGPDFRRQALEFAVPDVDAVLITHHHFDHVVGLDDLRPFLFGGRPRIPVYAMPSSANVLSSMFAYIFRDGSYPGVPRLDLREIRGPFTVRGRESGGAVPVRPIPAVHGSMDVLGFRVGGFAYLTDVSDIPEASLGLLEDLDVLVLDALRERPHPMHLTFDEAQAYARRIGARRTVFTHMTHDALHAEMAACLPNGMEPGYDGLTFEARSDDP